MSLTERDGYTDVVELCALLQCLGYSVKSLDTSDANMSQDAGIKSVVINCQASGLHVVMESGTAACSCPAANHHTSGFWQVSAISGGKQLDKECGSSLLGSLPKATKDRLARDLQEIVKCIKEHNVTDADLNRTNGEPSKTNGTEPVNKSASMVEMKTTPDKIHLQLKADTPTRYRSLDTLTNTKEKVEQLPPPGDLVKTAPPYANDSNPEDGKLVQAMCRRQSTYTIASTPSSIRRRNKTSSPIQSSQNNLLESLIVAEKTAHNLQNMLAAIITDYGDDEVKHDSSMSSLTLDVSKISLLKGAEAKQFSSSPNLSGLGVLHEDQVSKTKLRRFESVSTSHLAERSTPKEGGSGSKIVSKLRRLSPSLFNMKKDSPNQSTDKNGKNICRTPKLSTSNLQRPRIVTPVRVPKIVSEPSPNLSASRKKFSHIKSTIPRPSPARKE